MITLLNLSAGCGATLFALRFDDLRTAFWFMAAAAVADFLDGFTARALKSYSETGKQLDSLADMVSFGVAPSAILFSMYSMAGGGGYAGYAVFIIALFAALRLAKFNVDDRQSDTFIGLPTPAVGIFAASAGYLYAGGLYAVDPYYTVGVAAVLSYFMICNTPMFSLKFKNFGLKDNALRYVFIGLSVAALALWQVAAVPFIVMAYIVISIVRRMMH